MRLILRSPEFASRLAGKAAQLLPGFKHHQVLRAIAALYGYPSWQELVASCRPEAAPFVFDQYLAREAYDERRIAQALAVKDGVGIYLPYAYDFACVMAATRDFKRERPPRYVSMQRLDQEMTKEDDLWWAVFLEREHPLAPHGFSIAIATNSADVSRYRLGQREYQPREMWALLPDTPPPFPELTTHYYARHHEFLQIVPVPHYPMLRKSYRPTLTDFHEHGSQYGVSSFPEYKEFISDGRRRYETLARHVSVRTKRRLEQFGVEVREEMGKPWYWPLHPARPALQSDLIKELRKYGDLDYQIAEWKRWQVGAGGTTR